MRVGYYVHNIAMRAGKEISENEREKMPLEELVPCIKRTIITHKPRLTLFKITTPPQPTEEASQSTVTTKRSVASRHSRQQDTTRFMKRQGHRPIRKRGMTAK